MPVRHVGRGTDRSPFRAFVVGCPRSGTTLLQSMLAAHPDVLSFPETHFFGKIKGRFNRSKLGVVSPRAAAHQIHALEQTLGVSCRIPPWHLRLSAKAHGRLFADLVDEACRLANKKLWVEKSPTHLHNIDEIRAAIPSAKFVHILRDGRQVVASFYGICLNNPAWVHWLLPGDPVENLRLDRFDHRVLFAVVDRWNEDATITAGHVGRPEHLALTLDRLVSEPRPQLERVCAFLGLRFDEHMLDHATAAPAVIGERISYPHMRGALAPLRQTPSVELEALLPPQLVSHVESRLLEGGDIRAIARLDGLADPALGLGGDLQ